MFSPTTRPDRGWFAFVRRYRAVIFIATAGGALSFLLFGVMRDWERRETQNEFNAITTQRLELLREGLSGSLGVLNALGSLYSTGLPVAREHFRRFVTPALADRPELQALSWASRIPAADRARVEAAVRAEGFDDFEFTERDPDTGVTFRAPDQTDYYFPVLLVEPLAQNRTAFGRDISAPGGTAWRARDSGRATASSLIRLLQEETRQPGIVIHLPLYEGPVPATIAARRERCVGFVSAVFLLADMFDPVLARLPGIQVVVADVEPTSRSVTYSPPASDERPAAAGLLPATHQIPVADRTLQVVFTPTTTFHSARLQWKSWTALAGGLLITMLASSYLLTSQRRGEEIARANAALQSEVNERKHAEEAAAAANRAKSSFVTHLSHEIRTPLNAILGYAQILERDQHLPARHRDAITAIAGGGRHLLGLINSVLDLSRIEAGRAELHRVAFDVRTLLKGLTPMFLPRATEKGIALRMECQVPRERGAVLGDEGKLRQVLINLVGNAIKFTSRGEVVVRVRAAGEDTWLFEVIDSGVGFSESERIGLFRPFHQTIEGGRQGGSGLGLAIARGHVQLLGGRLELESRRGSGTRFYFALRLPAAVVSAADHPLQVPPRLARGIRVHALVVDDSRENRQILARLLGDIGCAVAEAGTARDARDLARQARPDVVFVDVFLAETTGPKLLTELRADGLPLETPVLLHTAALLSREQHETLRATGADLLQKPFRVDDLCACLRRIPGVEFMNASPAGAGIPVEAPEHLEELVLPTGLRERMLAAAELHSTTVLKECLLELRHMGGAACALADHLRHLLRGYDLAAITQVLHRLPAAGPALSKTELTANSPE